MRRPLPGDADALWRELDPKVRNQVRKAQKQSFTIEWGRENDLLDSFYDVFSRNMRDLGTPVFPRALFAAMLRHFDDAELCVLRDGTRPIAGAILVHGRGATLVPSASSLREYNSRCPNMLMYWELLSRAVARGSETFDFGRSSEDSNTQRFKAQWGATPSPTAWQVYLRRGRADDLRPQRGGFQLASRVWRRLPLGVTRWLGPLIVQGLPS
jgi:FemAB-related protein (PEP-CTERM system-associated)